MVIPIGLEVEKERTLKPQPKRMVLYVFCRYRIIAGQSKKYYKIIWYNRHSFREEKTRAHSRRLCVEGYIVGSGLEPADFAPRSLHLEVVRCGTRSLEDRLSFTE